MDQIKIGKFISECRKREKLTQAQLAEKMNIKTLITCLPYQTNPKKYEQFVRNLDI